MQKTIVWPLSAIYVLLVVYASLYPFANWRNQGIEPWAYLWAPWQRYWTWFDVVINVLGYIPLGGLLAVGIGRARRTRFPLFFAVLLSALLSLGLEGLQTYLPNRVASREDWLLNSLGAALGALCALVLERAGVLAHWSRLRKRWFLEQSRGGIVLLLVWPLALLFPASVPLGLGQVLGRLQDASAEYAASTGLLAWLPAREWEPTPLLAGGEWVGVLLGLLIPCLLAFCVIASRWHRAVAVLLVLLAGIGASALSAALTWGPAHVWAWLDTPAQWGLAVAMGLALMLVAVPARASAALALLSLGIYLSLLNQAPESPYFAQTLQEWEQGRFIRFNGLAQWLGWLWPFAAMLYVLQLVWRGDAQPKIDP